MKKMAVMALLLCTAVQGLLADGTSNFYTHGPRDQKVLALTFDDGPGPWTERVLDVLKKYNVKATFFMEGDQVEFRGAIAKKVLEAGHEIGNHTYSHMNFYAYKKDDREKVLAREIQKSGEFIFKATGVKTILLRMPNGFSREWARNAAQKENYALVNWTFGCDWKKMPTEQLSAVYIKNIQPGAIFLMHDGGKNRERTVTALPVIIEEIQKQGYKIVPVGELIKMNSGAVVAQKKGK
jgi:chitin deacetylase